MNIAWQIAPEDIENVTAFYDQHRANPFVQRRIRENLRDDKPPVTKAAFWDRMVGCLLTTQQQSGPNSPSTRFIRQQPSPLSYTTCRQQDDLAEFARSVIADFGGLRRSAVIGKELAANMGFLNDGGWKPTMEHLDEVRLGSSPENERRAAAFIDENFKGFGPKQSWNLLQGLGLSRCEIPFDSRIAKWMNAFGFPVHVTAHGLQDPDFYNLISDGFQRLCEACGLMPCVLDAAIFSSFDEGRWDEDNVVW